MQLKTEITLLEILGKKINESKRQEVEDYFRMIISPKFLGNGKENEVIKMEKSFETTCSIMQELGIQEPKRLTIFEFLSKIEYLEIKNKKS